MSRFFTGPENINGKYITLRKKEDIHHLSKVLRLKAGDRVDVSDMNEWEYVAVIAEINDDEVLLEIQDKQKFAREPELKVTLLQGIPKAGKMEGIIQKSVELGVHEIVPVFMDRTVVVDKGNFGKKLDRWQKISDEAVKQCKRGVIPRVAEAIKSHELTDALGGFDLVLMPYENEDDFSIKDCLKEYCSRGDFGENNKPGTVAIIIGPEGGISEKEAEDIQAAGGKSVTLGRTILRTETAGPAALAMVMYELEL